MTRAVLSNPSARAHWLLARVKDKGLRHWMRAAPLEGEEGGRGGGGGDGREGGGEEGVGEGR